VTEFEAEVYAREYLALRGARDVDRERWARHAVTLERAKRAGQLGAEGRRRGPAPKTAPKNAAELVEAAKRAAVAATGVTRKEMDSDYMHLPVRERVRVSAACVWVWAALAAALRPVVVARVLGVDDNLVRSKVANLGKHHPALAASAERFGEELRRRVSS